VNTLRAPVVTLLLPDLDGLDLELWGSLVPGLQPRLPRIPEVLLGRRAVVNPRLSALSILEPAVLPTNRQVDDQIEVLIKRRVRSPSLTPRVDEDRAVGARQREVTSCPQPFVRVEVHVHDLQETRIKVGEEVFLAPLETKLVVLLCERAVQGGPLGVGAPPGVVGRVRTPMQGTAHDVVAALGVVVVVSARLHDVDLSGLRPGAIRVVDGQHPDCGPEPVAVRNHGFDFDTAIFDRTLLLQVEAAGFNGLHDGAVGDVCGSDTVGPNVTAADALFEKVDDRIMSDERLVLEGGFDDHHAIFYEDVLIGHGGLLELAVAETAHFGFFGPVGLIEAFGEIGAVDGAVLVVHDCLETVVDEVSGEEETDCDAD